jgi:hypothetical protein
MFYHLHPILFIIRDSIPIRALLGVLCWFFSGGLRGLLSGRERFELSLEMSSKDFLRIQFRSV